MGNKQITIQQLVYDAKNGNIEAKKEIINHYTNLIIKTINEKYNDKNLNKTELIEAGINGIIYSIDKYDANSDTHFSTIVHNSIISRISTEAKFQQNINTHTKQVKFLINKVMQGDLEAKEKLAEYYVKRIIKSIETKYDNTNYDKEELIQAGCLGLSVAIKNYNKNFNVAFSTYVKRCINTYISIEINKLNNNLNTIYIENTYYDFISDIENKELIKKGFEKLNERYKKILILHLQGYSFKKIGKIYNLTEGRIHHIYKRSIEIIKEEVTGKKIRKRK